MRRHSCFARLVCFDTVGCLKKTRHHFTPGGKTQTRETQPDVKIYAV